MSEIDARVGSQSEVMSVLGNRIVCRQHRCLTLEVVGWSVAMPGQFVHIGPHQAENGGLPSPEVANSGNGGWSGPFLRRAFSIGGLTRQASGCQIELIYHVVGAGTRWMATLRPGDLVEAIGPLGNTFPTPDPGQAAWLIAGGVGLPPLLWFARTLAEGGQKAVFFLGARSADLVALSVSQQGQEWVAAQMPDTPLVLATEDGSAGLSGNVVQALAGYAEGHLPDASAVVVYTCGPEGMMRAVADFCDARSIRCVVCMERDMACGIGTCQSCVVPVRDPTDAEGWRYALCCQQGPIFEAGEVLWER